jgi:hypothetical protein
MTEEKMSDSFRDIKGAKCKKAGPKWKVGDGVDPVESIEWNKRKRSCETCKGCSNSVGKSTKRVEGAVTRAKQNNAVLQGKDIPIRKHDLHSIYD